MNLDYTLFHSIYNLLPHNAIFETVFLTISSLGHLQLIWLPLIIVFILFHRKKIGWVFLEAALASGTGTILNELFIKNVFTRPRPFLQFSGIPLLDYSATGYSFPSGHAITAFSIAAVFACGIKNKTVKVLLFTFAIMVAFSRIYLGAHYPMDVTAGALIGILFGYFTARLFPKFYHRLYHKK